MKPISQQSSFVFRSLLVNQRWLGILRPSPFTREARSVAFVALAAVRMPSAVPAVQAAGAAPGARGAAEGVRGHPEAAPGGRVRGGPAARELGQEPLPGRPAVRRHQGGAGAHQGEQHGIHQRVAHQSKRTLLVVRLTSVVDSFRTETC